MANHGLFIGWNRPIPMRESAAIEVFQSFLAFLGKQQQAGNIESFEPALLEVHGGDLNGFILIRGDRARLDGLRASDEFLELSTRAVFSVQNFGVLTARIGSELAVQMQRFGRIAAAK